MKRNYLLVIILSMFTFLSNIYAEDESVIDKAKRVFSLDNMSGSVGVIIAIIFTALLMYWFGTLIYKHIKKKSDKNNQV